MEYGYVIVTACITVAVCTFVALRPEDKCFRIAIGALLLSSVISPAISLIKELSFSYELSFDEQYSDAYEQSAEEAFTLGIRTEISREFSIPNENILVVACGFSAQSMRAEVIKVTLLGKGAFSNAEKIKEHVRGLGLGDCEVDISFA